MYTWTKTERAKWCLSRETVKPTADAPKSRVRSTQLPAPSLISGSTDISSGDALSV